MVGMSSVEKVNVRLRIVFINECIKTTHQKIVVKKRSTSNTKKGTREVKYIVLILLFTLVGCEPEVPSTICKDGNVYYQTGNSKSVYVKGVLTCIDINEEEDYMQQLRGYP
jgi:hypothetical protein